MSMYSPDSFRYANVLGTPGEAAEDGPIAKLQSGHLIKIDSDKGTINVIDADFDSREAVEFNDKRHPQHHGRRYRSLIASAEDGADYVAS